MNTAFFEKTIFQKTVSKFADKSTADAECEVLPTSLAELEIANLPPLLVHLTMTQLAAYRKAQNEHGIF